MDKGKNKAGMSEGSSSGDSEINTNFQKYRKLRILLYDADVQSSQQCSNLLRQCSSNYQGTQYMYISFRTNNSRFFMHLIRKLKIDSPLKDCK